MAFDAHLAARVRRQLAGTPELNERRMFGGICFTLHGNMCCGVLGEELIVHVPVDETAALLRRPHTRNFDFSGRPMRGFVVVGAEGIRHGQSLRKWLRIGTDFAQSLPAKK